MAATIYQRVSAYKGRQDDYTESTILAPTAGAVHSDPFRITNHPSLAGWKPYLDQVDLHLGELDPLTRRWTVGQAKVQLLDVRTNANRNLQEWWCAAFLGDSRGRNQFLGAIFAVEESYDLGGSWQLVFVGRCEETAVEDALFWRFTVQDLAADFDVEVFGTRPHPSATGVIEPLLCPVGLPASYAQFDAVLPLSGTIGASAYTNQTNARVLTLDAASQARVDNLITSALANAVMVMVPVLGVIANWSAGIGGVLRAGSVRCRISSASPSISNKELLVAQVIGKQRSDGHYAIKELLVTALTTPDGSLATTDPFYQAFDTGTVPNATVVTCDLRLGRPPLPVVRSERPGLGGWGTVAQRLRGAVASPLTPALETPPIITGNLPLMTFLADLLKGYYTPRYQPGEPLPAGSPAAVVGDPKYTWAYDTAGGSAWDKLVAATNRDPLPSTRWLIPQPWRLFDFLQKQIAQVFGVGYRFEPVLVSSVPKCRFVPIDLRLPTAAALAGIPTISDTALVRDGDLPSWKQGRSTAVSDLSVTYYNDVAVTPQAVADLREPIPTVPTSLLIPIPATSLFPAIGGTRAIGIGSRPLALEALGIRFTIASQDAVQNVQAQEAARAASDAVEAQYKSMFGAGAAFITFTAPRSSTVGSLFPGDWCYLQAAEIPSPGTNKRGDTRLVLLVSRQPDGPLWQCTAVDLGAGAVCSSPTIGTPTQQTGNTNHGVTVALTANAQSDPMEVRYYVDITNALTTPPADSDAGWVFGLRAAATGSFSLPNLPSNVRVFPQVRAVPAPGQGSVDQKLASAWIAPSGTKYVTTGAASAPTLLSVTPATILTTSAVQASWTNPAASVAFYIGVYLNSTLVATLAPGSVGVVLNPYLAANTAYTLEVRYFDGLTGRSPAASTSFTTPVGFGGPTLTAPTLAIV